MSSINPESILEPSLGDDTPEDETSLERRPGSELSRVFDEQEAVVAPLGHFKFKRTLTKPLVAMAHMRQFFILCDSDMYTLTLPARSRGAAPTPVRAIDGRDIETSEEITLLINEMMASAMSRAGYRVLRLVKNELDESTMVETDGYSLIGAAFAFKRGEINEEKGYRVVETVELQQSQ